MLLLIVCHGPSQSLMMSKNFCKLLPFSKNFSLGGGRVAAGTLCLCFFCLFVGVHPDEAPRGRRGGEPSVAGTVRQHPLPRWPDHWQPP